MTDAAYTTDNRTGMPRFGAPGNNNTPLDTPAPASLEDVYAMRVPQDRFNLEMFRALELLGRKLERVEGERDQLAQRLEQIEAAASVDEATGRLYLPAVIEAMPQASPMERHAARWAVGAALSSSVLAICALGIVVFRSTVPDLTPQQLAALNTLGSLQMALTSNVSPKAASQTQDLAQAQIPAQAQALADVQPAAGDAKAEEANTVDAKDKSATAHNTAPMPPQPQAAQPAAAAVSKDLPPVNTADEKTAVAAKPDAPAVAAAVPETVPETAQDTAASQPVVKDMTADSTLPKALQPLEQRALGGEAEAQHDLGTIYASGTLVPQNYAKAAAWFRHAAENGVPNAAYNLGVMTQQGLGVDKDAEKAVTWYDKAASQGHPEALYNLGIAYTKGIGVARDMARGVSYFKRAANAGVAQAAYNLGVLYEGSLLGKPDPLRARQWYEVAANQGHGDAKAALARMKDIAPDEATAVEKDTAAATPEAAKAAAVEPAAGDAAKPADAAGDLTPGERAISAPSIVPVDR